MRENASKTRKLRPRGAAINNRQLFVPRSSAANRSGVGADFFLPSLPVLRLNASADISSASVSEVPFDRPLAGSCPAPLGASDVRRRRRRLLAIVLASSLRGQPLGPRLRTELSRGPHAPARRRFSLLVSNGYAETLELDLGLSQDRGRSENDIDTAHLGR